MSLCQDLFQENFLGGYGARSPIVLHKIERVPHRGLGWTSPVGASVLASSLVPPPLTVASKPHDSHTSRVRA